MKVSHYLLLGSLILAATLTSSCSTVAIMGKPQVQAGAFGAKKRFALVSVSAGKEFRGEKGLTQTFKNIDDIPGANSQPMLDALAPSIVKTLDASPYFVLVPESKILTNAAYKATVEDERAQTVLFTKQRMNTAAGYKYLVDPAKLSALVDGLGVDGVLVVSLQFSFAAAKSGIQVSGISLGKKSYSSIVSAFAIAYDKTGTVVWKDVTMKQAEPGDTKAIVALDLSDITGTSYEKLQPSAIEMGKKAIDTLLSRFSDTLAGLDVSSVQALK